MSTFAQQLRAGLAAGQSHVSARSGMSTLSGAPREVAEYVLSALSISPDLIVRDSMCPACRVHGTVLLLLNADFPSNRALLPSLSRFVSGQLGAVRVFFLPKL